MSTELAYRDSMLFMDMDEEQIRRFLAMGFHFQYSAGSQLVSCNDSGETFFLILSGTAKIMLTNARSEQVNLSLIRAGEFFGELSMLDKQSQRTADVVAVSDMEVVTLHKPEFLKALYQMPILAINIARVLGERLRSTNERLSIQTLPEESRIAEVILQLAKKGTAFVDGGPILLPHLSLQEWTLFCTTSRGKFMAVIETLKDQGALEWQNQRIVVKDTAMLGRFAHDANPAHHAEATMLQ